METDAFINWGRWVAGCTQCANAEELTEAQETLLCGRCGTESVIRWPDSVDAIHAVLAHRVAPENRNWIPGETVADLADENVAHGLPAGV